jgi:hypothetical protein
MGHRIYFTRNFSGLIYLKVPTPKAGYESKMVTALDPARISLVGPNSAKVVQRLLAHARLCREIAALSWNEADARKLEEMAAECVRWADAAGAPTACGPLH